MQSTGHALQASEGGSTAVEGTIQGIEEVARTVARASDQINGL